MEYNFWIRTPAGLEDITIDELNDKVDLGNFCKGHRNVFAQINSDFNIEEIKTADDIYKFVGNFIGVDNKKASLDDLFVYFEEKVLKEISNLNGAIRVTASFLGKRNYNRFFIENGFSQIIKDKTNLKVLNNEKGDTFIDGENRLRVHIEDQVVYIGLALTDKPIHRRSWRELKYDGQLDTSISAAMVRILGEVNNYEIIDPFCGSGTILIESALVNKNLHTGFDINVDAINIANENSKKANVDNLKFIEKNAFDNFELYKDKIIVTNPPWDKKHMIKDNLSKDSFVTNLLEIIKKSKKSVIIVPEYFLEIIESNNLKIEKQYQTRVRGFVAFIILVDNSCN